MVRWEGPSSPAEFESLPVLPRFGLACHSSDARRFTISLVLLLLFLAASCGNGGEAAPGALASISAPQEDSSLAPVATNGELRFLTDDGVALAGRVFGTGTVGVVMAHESGGSSTRWDSLAPAIAGEGYRVLAFSLRGHGGSEGEPGAGQAEDVLAAIAYLRDESLSRVVVLGVGDAGVGALDAATQSPAVIGVVSIAPSADDADDKSLVAIEGLDTPTLLFTAETEAAPARELAGVLNDSELTLYNAELPDGDLLAGPIGPDLWSQVAGFVEDVAG